MEEEYISQRQLAMRAAMAETTCRRYLSQFQEYMKYKKEGQRVLYSSENINVLKTIANMYAKGLSENQVRERMVANFSTYYDVEDDEKEETFDLVTSKKERQIQATEKLVQVLQDLSDQKKEIEKVDEKHEKRSEELFRQLQEQQKIIEEQQKILDQVVDKKTSKKSWWQKIFG